MFALYSDEFYKIPENSGDNGMDCRGILLCLSYELRIAYVTKSGYFLEWIT